jgi:membrane protease YdiL (CAAX protease family)
VAGFFGKEEAMTSVRAFVNRYAVQIYYLLTFAISWGGILVVVGGPSGLTEASQNFDAQLPMGILAMLLGPSISGILMTLVVEGTPGLRGFWSRLIKWRLGVRWYAIALLMAPILMPTLLIALSQFSPEFVPQLIAATDKAAVLSFAIAVGLAAGIFEEIGWTGFATYHLRERHSVFTTGLIVGFWWAVWHLLPAYWFGSAGGVFTTPLAMVSYALDPFLFLMAYRMLMVWAYDHTESLLLGMVMHASLTTATRLFAPEGIAGLSLITSDLLWAAIVWLIVLVIANREHLARPPLYKEASVTGH